jgi:hypothetical protein
LEFFGKKLAENFPATTEILIDVWKIISFVSQFQTNILHSGSAVTPTKSCPSLEKFRVSISKSLGIP